MDQIVDQADVLLERLLSAIDKGKLSAERRAALKTCHCRVFKRHHDARWIAWQQPGKTAQAPVPGNAGAQRQATQAAAATRDGWQA